MMTTTRQTSLFSPGLRALTASGVTIVAVQAFEAVAVSTVMPTVATALGALNHYTLAFGIPAAAGIVGMVAAGVWSDRRGPVAALATGWLLFVAGLVVSGTAASMTVLIGGRALQGLGSGLTTVAIYVVVARGYPEALRPKVFSVFAAAWVLPALVGPAIAGIVVLQVGWRWVFLSIPIIAAAAAAVGWAPCRRLSRLPADRQSMAGGRSEDRGKLAFAAVAAVAACLLSVAGQSGPVIAVPVMSVAAALLVWAVPHLLPRGTYRSARGLPTVILLRGLVSAAFIAAEVFLPLLLFRERGLSPAEAGIVLTVGALGWSAGSAVQGRVSSAARRPALLQLGFGLLTLGIVLASGSVWRAVPLLSVYPAWAIAGLGIGMAYPTLSVLTLELSSPADEGNNTAALQVNDALLQAITLALSGTVFATLVSRSHVAPYLAGFAIAAAAAGAGALLARRVRPSGRNLVPGADRAVLLRGGRHLGINSPQVPPRTGTVGRSRTG